MYHIIKRIGLTGTPGTGKHSVGSALSKLTGLEHVSLSDIAIKAGAGRWEKEEFLVETAKLRKLKIETEGRIISGHLLPYVIPQERLDFVAILRCSPQVLRRRYLSRGYSISKINENVEAELLDIISFKCLESYGRKNIAEFDTTRTLRPKTVARRIESTITGKSPHRYGIAPWSLSASRSPRDLKRLLRGIESAVS